MTTTDEALVTDEEIAREIEQARFDISSNNEPTLIQRVCATLSDRLAARERQLDLACQDVTELRKERAEMVALLEATGDYQATDYCDGAEGDEPLSNECYDEKPCWSHRAAALLAKLRGTP